MKINKAIALETAIQSEYFKRRRNKLSVFVVQLRYE
jgi:hypothetical protein